jgi:hypothetical protein
MPMSDAQQEALSERLALVFKHETQYRVNLIRTLLQSYESYESCEAGESGEAQVSSDAMLSKLIPLQLEVHSLKGAARSVDRMDIEMLCQDAEMLVMNALEQKGRLSKNALATLYQLITYLEQVVVRSSPTSGVDLHSLQATLRALANTSYP